MDFGSGGKSFYHTWWSRGPEELNTPEFKAELQEVVDELRKTVLQSLGSMRRYWERFVIARNRKTLALCTDCHNKLHSGKLN